MSFIEEDNSKKTGDLKSFLFLFSFAKNWNRYYYIGFSLLVISSFSAISSAYFLGQLVDKGLKQSNLQNCVLFASLVILLELANTIIMYIGRNKIAIASSNTILNIRKKMYDHIHRLPISYYDKQPLGRTVTRVSHDVESLDEFFSSSLSRMATLFLLATMALFAMLVTNFQLGFLLSLAIAPSILFTLLTKEPTRKFNRDMAKKNSSINAQLNELINALPIIRWYGLEKWSRKLYDAKVIEYLRSTLRINLFYSFTRPVISLLCHLPLICLLFFGSKMVLNDSLALGIFVAYIRYCERFANPIVLITREIHILQQAFTYAERIADFLKADTENHIFKGNGELTAENLEGEIEFKDLSMSYNKGELVLKNINFKVSKGSNIGLLGQTGSGKSTCVALLSQLYPHQKGEILIDGVNIKDFNRQSLRQQIGVVSQDPAIFKDSLKNNLSLGQTFSEKEIQYAIKETGLDNVMKNAGLNLDSQLTENGENLSLGQRQLLSITRVFLRKPKILILDEATANIDEYYEELIQKTMEKLMKSRTCFIIAHRLKTLAHCDYLLVFKNGEIVEQGLPNELQQSAQYYQELLKTYNEAPSQTLN